jgi:UDP-N-acetylmuramoylalanine--D-glutamate ligase
VRGLELLPRGGQWRGVRVGVLGLGRSGRGALRLLERHGADASAFEDRIESATLDALHDEGLGHVEPRPARDGSAALVQELDVLVVSPGVPGKHPMVAAAEIAGVVVISELELAWRRTRGDVIAVTGTNGKSTTVSLIHELLKAGGLQSALAGNIGIALSDEVESVDEDGVLVVECSSFQLERIMDFHPRVAAILNIAPDHLDRYDSFEAYVVAKHNLLRNQLPGDLFVYPAGDGRLEEWARVGVARVARFSVGGANDVSAWVEDGILMRANEAVTEKVCPVSALRLIGQHNLLNITAALAAISPWKVPVEQVAEVLRRFEALPHRAVCVQTDDGRTWIDDSKATNVHAASATLAGIDGPVVLLVGGSDKDEDYTPLADFADRIRGALCFGAEAERLQAALGSGIACETFGRMIDALERANEIAVTGDTVLLSPACASFDEFSGFAERGEVFADWVRRNAGVSV